MNYELKKGRPQNIEGRLEKEIRTYDLLDRLGVEYEYIDHEALMTIEACAEVDQHLGAVICKNLFLHNSKKTEFFLLMLPGEKKMVTKELSKKIGSTRLSFAGPEYMEEFLDITPGSVSVMGLMNDKENRVTLLIDRELLEEKYVGCHPCMNTTSLRIKMADLLVKILPEIGHEPIFVDL